MAFTHGSLLARPCSTPSSRSTPAAGATLAALAEVMYWGRTKAVVRCDLAWTLIAEDAAIRRVICAVLAPDWNPDDVLAWLRSDLSCRQGNTD